MGRSTSGVIVQKFGGTSVADPDSRASLVQRVEEGLADGARVVVVVSAMGREGDPYSTDTLLGLIRGEETDAYETDKLAACGEIISSVVVAHALRSADIPARSFSGVEAGIVTDGEHGSADVIRVVPDDLLASLRRGEVPVVAGFQGMAPDGRLTTLGRGGSDTTACALAVALSADRVEIFTDVDGVMTADPDASEGARVLDVVEYDELFQMARHGSRVVHALAAETAMEGGVPVRVRSTFSGAPGTLVTDARGAAAEGVSRVATAVSHVDDVARFTVALPPDDEDGGHMAAQTEVFRSMADAGVSLDMFTPCDDKLVFSTSEADVPRAVATLDAVALPYRIDVGLAKVTLVGTGMHGVPGVMARVAETLRGSGVTIVQVSDSHATISVLVWQNRRSRAVDALHEAFGLGGAQARSAADSGGG